MQNENSQKELFEFEAPKKAGRRRFGSLLQRTDFCLVLTAEKLVFVFIGIIMLAVLFFALGVERGKSLVVKSEPQAAPVQASTTQIPAKAANPPISQEKTVEPAKGKPYTIVAAAYSRQDFASKEVVGLKASGLDAFVLKSEPYYLACVGSYATKGDAQKALSKARQAHRDAYIRLK